MLKAVVSRPSWAIIPDVKNTPLERETPPTPPTVISVPKPSFFQNPNNQKIQELEEELHEIRVSGTPWSEKLQLYRSTLGSLLTADKQRKRTASKLVAAAAPVRQLPLPTPAPRGRNKTVIVHRPDKKSRKKKKRKTEQPDRVVLKAVRGLPRPRKKLRIELGPYPNTRQAATPPRTLRKRTLQDYTGMGKNNKRMMSEIINDPDLGYL